TDVYLWQPVHALLCVWDIIGGGGIVDEVQVGERAFLFVDAHREPSAGNRGITGLWRNIAGRRHHFLKAPVRSQGVAVELVGKVKTESSKTIGLFIGWLTAGQMGQPCLWRRHKGTV